MGGSEPRVVEEGPANGRGSGDPLAGLARARDWAATPLGPIGDWPDALRHATLLCLAAPEPAIIWWGRDLLQVYNAAAIPLYQQVHPAALGWVADHAPPAGWDVLQQHVAGALTGGHAAGVEHRLLAIEGPAGPEDRYFSTSLIPIRGGSGEVGGVLGLLRDTTAPVVEAGRLRLLADLGAALAGVSGAEDACRAAAGSLARFPRDLPFALLYLSTPDGQRARLIGLAGTERDTPRVPGDVALATEGDEPAGWPFARVVATGQAASAGDLCEPSGASARDAAPGQSPPVLLVPLISTGADRPVGVLVAGLPRRWVGDDGHHAFLQQIAGQIAAAVVAGEWSEAERGRALALATLDEAKTAFFADLGQEFVQPLSLMLGPIQALQAGARAAADPRDRELLAIAQRACLRLLKLVNTFHQFVRLEAGIVAANREETDLAQFTADLASMFRPAAEAAGLRLIVDCPALPWPVLVDRGMWEKIVLNLLSNAVKHTHRGEIAVTVGSAEAGDGDRVRLTVRDTGAGIAPRDVDRLLERYQRVRGNGGRTREGFGIGLSLVRELTRLHGGTVTVESAVGEGSTFIVTIPAPVAQRWPGGAAVPTRATPQAPAPYVGEARRWLSQPQAPARTERLPRTAPGEAHERVLVVAEPADLRAYLRRLLATHWPVETAGDDEEAVAAARAHPPALVLADMAMPGSERVALVRALRNHPVTSTVPVVLLSGRADVEGTVGGLEAGADDVLPLPFAAQELLARIQAHIHLAHLRREAQTLREEFIAAAAHDLRTPLTSIQIGLGLLDVEMMGLSPDARDVLDAVRRNAQRLAIHVGDLVTANQLSGNLVRVQSEPLDLRDVVREAVAAVQPLFREKGQRVDVALPRPLPILGDARRMEQVFVNLLANAHHHTPSGTRVTIACSAAGSDVHLVVSDTGPGLPARELEHIFERHRQLQPGRGGSGLGLAIARSLIDLHGGRVWAESPPGQGAQFHIALPPGRRDRRAAEVKDGEGTCAS